MAKQPSGMIELPELRRQHVQIKLVGDSPLIVHRFDEKARRAILDKQMGKAKTGRENKDPEADYRASMYRTDDGRPGFPAIAFKASAVNAANDAGIQKTLARRAFHVEGEIIPIDGEPSMREDVVRIAMGNTDIRHRAEFKRWSVTLDIVFNAGIISLPQLINLFQIAGFGVGVGEWRPERNGIYGTFHVATEKEV